jgi:hypothetical protein
VSSDISVCSGRSRDLDSCLLAPTAALLLIFIIKGAATMRNDAIYKNVPFLGFLMFVLTTSAGSCYVHLGCMPRLEGKVHRYPQADDGKVFKGVSMKKG